MGKAKDKDFDWQAAEREYRAGSLSNREIGKLYGPSEAAIRKRAKQEGWEKDLSKQVQQATKAKLTREEKEVEDAQIVNEAAARNVKVILAHRNDVAKLLEAGRLVLARVVEVLQPQADDEGKAKPMDAMTVKHASKAYSDATGAFHKAVQLERQAFNIDENNGEGEGGKIKLPGLTILINGQGSPDAG